MSLSALRRNILFLALLIPMMLVMPLSVVASGDNVLHPDVAVTREVQDVNAPGASRVVEALNQLGSVDGLLILSAIVAATLLYAGRRQDAVFAMMPVLVTQFANFALKLLFSSPRPTADLVTVTDRSSGFGFPSAHTMTTVVVVGCLAFIVLRGVECRWRRAFVIGAAAFITLGMGFSRIYVGAHWPSDVLGAYLWGIAFTALMILAYQATRLSQYDLVSR